MKKVLLIAAFVALSGGSAFATTVLPGNTNTYTSVQFGFGNFAGATQTGNDNKNTGHVTQVGAFNINSLYQGGVGNHNSASSFQFGVGNASIIVQN